MILVTSAWSITLTFDLWYLYLDPIFFLHHAQVDRLWYIWQKADPEKRMMAYAGGNGVPGGGAATLDDILPMAGLANDRVVRDLMSTVEGGFCYKYVWCITTKIELPFVKFWCLELCESILFYCMLYMCRRLRSAGVLVYWRLFTFSPFGPEAGSYVMINYLFTHKLIILFKALCRTSRAYGVNVSLSMSQVSDLT